MSEFIQVKNHLSAKFAKNPFHSHHTSKTMREFIVVKNLLNAKLATKPFHNLVTSKPMRKIIPDKNHINANFFKTDGSEIDETIHADSSTAV